ncbi:MAG: hypothetical protein AAGL98_11290, partial [Planctomycetota bacterium]
ASSPSQEVAGTQIALQKLTESDLRDLGLGAAVTSDPAPSVSNSETAAASPADALPQASGAVAITGTVVDSDELGDGNAATGLVSASWSVDLPFSRDSGVPVVSINGIPIESLDEIDDALRASTDPGEQTEVQVAFGVPSPDGNGVREQITSLPVVYTTALADGTTFETRDVSGKWTTTISSISPLASTDLRAGDVLVAYIPTSSFIGGQPSLQSVLDTELGKGVTQFNFAVMRNGEMWVGSLSVNPEATE